MASLCHEKSGLLKTGRGIMCLVECIDRVIAVASKLFQDRQDVGKASTEGAMPERGGGDSLDDVPWRNRSLLERGQSSSWYTTAPDGLKEPRGFCD